MLDGQLGMLYPSFYLKAHIIVIMYYHNTCTGSYKMESLKRS